MKDFSADSLSESYYENYFCKVGYSLYTTLRYLSGQKKSQKEFADWLAFVLAVLLSLTFSSSILTAGLRIDINSTALLLRVSCFV